MFLRPSQLKGLTPLQGQGLPASSIYCHTPVPELGWYSPQESGERKGYVSLPLLWTLEAFPVPVFHTAAPRPSSLQTPKALSSLQLGFRAWRSLFYRSACFLMHNQCFPTKPAELSTALVISTQKRFLPLSSPASCLPFSSLSSPPSSFSPLPTYQSHCHLLGS